MEIKFRAKIASEESGHKWCFGFPKLHFGEDINRKKYHRWYLNNYNICFCSKSNYIYREGEEYKSEYSYQIDIDTLQISIDGGEWQNCTLPDVFTKDYQPI